MRSQERSGFINFSGVIMADSPIRDNRADVRKLRLTIAIALFIITSFFLFSGEFLASMLNNRLDSEGRDFLFRFAFTFKPSVIAVFLASWVLITLLSLWILKPIFDFIRDGRNYEKARIVALKFPWIMIITQDVFWLVGTFAHSLTKHFQADSGIDWQWIEFMKLSNGNLSALFTVLVINVILMKVKTQLNLTDIREGENDIFIRNKDYILFISLAIYVIANIGYIAYYFSRRSGAPDPVLLNVSVIITGLALIVPALVIILFSKREYFFQIGLLKEKLLDLQKGHGDLSSRIILTNFDEIGDLAFSFNRFLDYLNHDIVSLKNIVGQVQSNSEKLFQSAQKISQGSEGQSVSTQSISATMNQFSSMMMQIQDNILNQTKNIQNNTAAAEELSRGIESIVDKIITVRNNTDINLKSAEEGIRKVNLSVEKSLKMSENVEVISGKINEAGHQSEHIDEILRSIQDIAERTNLLSLNASIEAAHAGDAGKGFAIVAQEIRELANLSAGSADNIAKLLGVMRDIIRQAVELSGNVEKDTRENNNLAKESGSALKSIIQNMQNISSMVSEIGRITEEQDKISKDFLKNIEELKDFSGNIQNTVKEQTAGAAQIKESLLTLSQRITEGAESSEHLTNSARELESVGKELADISGQFKVKENQ